MLTQTKAKTARRVDLNAVERPALLKIRLKSDANFLLFVRIAWIGI